MKTLVVYDSVFGNTEKVAKAIAQEISDAAAMKVGAVRPEHLKGLKMLFVGSPTRAFRPTDGIKKFLKAIPANGLNGIKVAAFDTRADMNGPGIPSFLRFMVNIFGYADKPIMKSLEKKGGEPCEPSAGFIVKGAEGPLNDGELQRAVQWAKKTAGPLA